MFSLRWRPVAGLVLACACSATIVEPHDRPSPSSQAMRTAPPADVAPPPATAAAPSKLSEAPGFCDQVPSGMSCVPGGPLAGADVELSPFYIDRRPVSAGEYAACHAAGACTRRPVHKNSPPDAPAVLDWLRAREVCAWHGKRLPSEWEWQRAASELGATGLEWTGTAGAKQCGESCAGRDPLGPCDGAHPCGGARVLRSSSPEGARVVEPLHATRREPGVRCASSTATLTHWPPRQISDPWPKRGIPEPLSDADRARVAQIDQDPIEDKKICDESVRAGWSESLQRGGRATTTCRDPFPYVKANEARTHVWAPFVADVGGGYVGVASDQNYSLIAAARSEVAWLIDYDPRVVAQHRRLRALILRSETPVEFVARFAPEAQKSSLAVLDEVYAGAPDLAALKAGFRATREELWPYYEAARTGGPRDAATFGWLRDPDRYAYVRALYQQGRIVPLKGDLMGSKTLAGIARAARELDVPIRVLYLSNAPTAWGGDLVPQFRDNIRALPFDERSLVLQTTNTGGFRQMGYWHYNIASGPAMQRLLGLAGYDKMWKTLAERIPTPDGDVTVLALPGAPR